MPKKALEQKLQEASNQDAPSSSQIKELCRQNEELQRKVRVFKYFLRKRFLQNEELAIENEIFEKRYEAQCKENAKLKMGEIQSNEWV